LIDASKEVGPEVNTEKTKFMLLSRHQIAVQNYVLMMGNIRFENVAQFRYLGTTINQNLKTTILPVALYECETWSLKLRREHRLRVFENRVLRTIFVPKRDEVTVGWRKLHNEELHNFYSLSIIIRMIKPRRMRWAGHEVRMGEKMNTYRISVGKPKGKEIGWDGMDWTDLADDRDQWRALVNAIIKFLVQ
ncbi:hypothetical protein B7P43_G03093, partial [Cryptotermes secundus]